MESRLEKHKRYLNKLEKHAENAGEAAKYSADRFDILIISLSTTGLVFSISILNNETLNPDIGYLQISWILFAIAVITNLFSQITSYHAHKFDLKATQNLIRETRGKSLKSDQIRNEASCRILNNCTVILNLSSFILLVGGILLSLISIIKF